MVLTPETLGSLIERQAGIGSAEALGMAETVLSYFGYGTVIIDNAIDSEDRKLFYRLQDLGLLRSTWETVLLPSGKSWRIFYWELPDESEAESPQDRPDEGFAYDSLPEEVWGRAEQLG